MSRYIDPRGRFNIAYPAGWRVRSADGSGTAFYIDDPDEGIAVRVHAPDAVRGNIAAGALPLTWVQHMRRAYQDFTYSVISTKIAASGEEQSEFSARWTNRWGQRMLASGVIVTAPRGAETTYAYMAGQAQELMFPALEPIFQQIRESFRLSPRG